MLCPFKDNYSVNWIVLIVFLGYIFKVTYVENEFVSILRTRLQRQIFEAAQIFEMQ